MRGAVTIKAGKFRLSPTESLWVRASDAGVILTLEDRQTGRRYTAVINEHGALVWPQQAIRPVEPPEEDAAASVAALPSPPVPKRPARPPAEPYGQYLPVTRMTKWKSLNIKFTIRYSRLSRPRNIARVVGGYRSGERIYVLYRVVGHGSACDSIMMLLHVNRVVVGDAVPEADRLPDNKWDFFLSLPPRATIKLRRCWQKMSEDELRALVGGRIFTVSTRGSRN